MKGSTRKRSKTWTAYWFTTDADGQRVQKSKGGFRISADAQRHLTDVLGKVQDGSYSEPKKMTVAQFLRNEWLPSLDLRPTTIQSYTLTAERWLIPHLGGVALPALTPKQIQAALETIRASGAKGRPLKPRSVQYAYTVLRMALTYAVLHGFIPRNPAALTKRPKGKAAEQKAWTAEEARSFLKFVSGDRLYLVWLLFLTRGFRRRELAGLRWQDVDVDGSRISVRATRVLLGTKPIDSLPKTDRGVRTVPLDETLVGAFKTHRRRELEGRLAWGEGWIDSGLVFTCEDGTPLRPDFLSGRFERLAKRAGLPRIRLHDTRHTAATLALRAGIRVEVVSRWLGHASVAITQEIYMHAIPSMMEEAGAELTDLILGGER